jgi:hypothetical protein
LQAWAAGYGDGRLGLGDRSTPEGDISTPEQLTSPTNGFAQVAVGGGYTAFLDASGAVRTPLVPRAAVCFPIRAGAARRASSFSSSYYSTRSSSECLCCAAWQLSQLQCASSTLRIGVVTMRVVLLRLCCVGVQAWMTGFNTDGRLGLGDTIERSTPAQLTSPTDIVYAAAGAAHTVFADRSGTVRQLVTALLAVAAADNFSIRFRLLCCSCVMTGVDDGSQRQGAARPRRSEGPEHAGAADLTDWRCASGRWVAAYDIGG